MIRQAAAVVVALCLSASPLHAQSAPNTKKVTVGEASATVHKTPSVGSPVVGNAPRGTELVVTREVGSWVKVAWPSAADGVGYVRVSSLASATAAAPAASAAKAPAASKPAATAKAAPASTTAKAAPAKAAPAAGTKATEPAMAPVSAKAAVAPTPTVAPVAVRSEQVPISQPTVQSARTPQYVAPTHIFGVGAMAGSPRGLGGSARAWKKGRLGMQLEVSRYTYDSVDLLSRASSTDIAPGVLFALNDRVSDSLWLRPYVGVSAHMIHSSRTDLIFADATESANTFGARVFVGSEMSLASMPALALSVDAGYYRQPEPFVGFEPGGMGFSVSAHWYVK